MSNDVVKETYSLPCTSQFKLMYRSTCRLPLALINNILSHHHETNNMQIHKRYFQNYLLFHGRVFFTILQMQRYLQNDDISRFAFKQFNVSPRDKYPTFTICCSSYIGEIYNDKYLKSVIESNGRTYKTILSGIKDSISDETILKKTLNINFQNASIKLKRILNLCNVMTPKSLIMLWPIKYEDDADSSLPLSISYRDPGNVCFTGK